MHTGGDGGPPAAGSRQGQLPEPLQALQSTADGAQLTPSAVNSVGTGGWTPLLLAAARGGSAEAVQALVRRTDLTDASKWSTA